MLSYGPMVETLSSGVTLGFGVGNVPRNRSDSLIIALSKGSDSNSAAVGKSEVLGPRGSFNGFGKLSSSL